MRGVPSHLSQAAACMVSTLPLPAQGNLLLRSPLENMGGILGSWARKGEEGHRSSLAVFQMIGLGFVLFSDQSGQKLNQPGPT